MRNNSFIKFYRVFKNETTVTEISTNNFKPASAILFKKGLPLSLPEEEHFTTFYYSLPPDEAMFYGYTSKVKAMEHAKAGALLHINSMIANVVEGIKKLKDYRSEHHEDLNMILLESNIRKLEKEMYIK
jgi:hypothetical protein